MIYENVLKLCQEKGIRIGTLERAAGLGNATIRRWKTATPSVETLKKVATALGVTVNDLIK